METTVALTWAERIEAAAIIIRDAIEEIDTQQAREISERAA